MIIDNIAEKLSGFKGKKIAVFGDLMLDKYVFGTVDRISPEAPVPVVNVTNETSIMGGAANVVNNLWNLGAKVYCFGVLGKDDDGETLVKEFEKKNIDISGLIVDSARKTIAKKRVIAHNQQLLRLDWEDKKELEIFEEDIILHSFKKNYEEIDGVIFSDYNKGFFSESISKDIIKFCREKAIPVMVDPKPSNMYKFKGASSITPNFKEAMNMLGDIKLASEEEFRKLIIEKKEEYKLDNILVTRSEKGMTIFSENIEDIPTVAREVYDVTGAGDTVISVFALAYTLNRDFNEAAKIANLAAGIVVGKIGTSVVSIDDIIDYYEKIRGSLD